jgi:hypothetical protein
MSSILDFNKKQEAHLNILFNPLENELFKKRVDLEVVGDDLLSSLSTYDNESLISFWMIDNQLDTQDQAKFCRIIPLLHSIVGDFPLTAKCLAFFLQEPVSWKIVTKELSVRDDRKQSLSGIGLGEYSCGNSMVMHGIMSEFVQTIVFSIGPVTGENILYYLEGGKKHRLIDHFIDYFIPLQYEVELEIEVSQEDNSLTLDNSFLGLDTALNTN